MNHRAKVCIVAPVHRWDDVRVFHKEAATLAHEGYDVVLLAQSDAKRRERGVWVHRAWVPRGPRLLRFLAVPAVFLQALGMRAHIYHLHNPDTLPVAIALKAFGKTVIYDTHEDFAERILAREWIPAWARKAVARLVGKLEQVVARMVDASVATQPEVAQRLGPSAVVIGNPPRIDQPMVSRVETVAARIAVDVVALRAVYIGGISIARGIVDMVRALELANEHAPVRLWLIGPADKAALAMARRCPGWQFVDYLEWKPQEEAFAYLARSDVGIIALHDVGGHRNSDPNKLYEYMAFGVPFIASDFAVWRRRLVGYDAGWFVSPANVRSLADAIIAAQDRDIRTAKGRGGKEFVKSYNWGQESGKLLALYDGLL